MTKPVIIGVDYAYGSCESVETHVVMRPTGPEITGHKVLLKPDTSDNGGKR